MIEFFAQNQIFENGSGSYIFLKYGKTRKINRIMATISFKEAAIAYRTLDLGKFAYRKGSNGGSKFESSFKSASSILLSHNFLMNDEPLNASAVSLNPDTYT